MSVSDAAEDKSSVNEVSADADTDEGKPKDKSDEKEAAAAADEGKPKREADVEVKTSAEPDIDSKPKSEPEEPLPDAEEDSTPAPSAGNVDLLEPPVDAPLTLDDWLKETRLTKYKGALEELGVESVEDLRDVTDDDLGPLGMKKLEVRRFQAGLKNTIMQFSNHYQEIYCEWFTESACMPLYA